jgi:hypothetical protein
MSRNLRSVAQHAAGGPFTQNQLRWWIFNAASNGLAEAGAVVRVQGRVYIDVDRFDYWIERQNAVPNEGQRRTAEQPRAA